MYAQLHQATGLVAGRPRSQRDLAQRRDVELAQQDAQQDQRRARRGRRRR